MQSSTTTMTIELKRREKNASQRTSFSAWITSLSGVSNRIEWKQHLPFVHYFCYCLFQCEKEKYNNKNKAPKKYYALNTFSFVSFPLSDILFPYMNRIVNLMIWCVRLIVLIGFEIGWNEIEANSYYS